MRQEEFGDSVVDQVFGECEAETARCTDNDGGFAGEWLAAFGWSREVGEWLSDDLPVGVERFAQCWGHCCKLQT